MTKWYSCIDFRHRRQHNSFTDAESNYKHAALHAAVSTSDNQLYFFCYEVQVTPLNIKLKGKD